MYQSGRAGDEAKKRKSPAKSGRVGIYDIGLDSAFDLWLLGHFKLRIFRLSHGASRTGV